MPSLVPRPWALYPWYENEAILVVPGFFLVRLLFPKSYIPYILVHMVPTQPLPQHWTLLHSCTTAVLVAILLINYRLSTCAKNNREWLINWHTLCPQMGMVSLNLQSSKFYFRKNLVPQKFGTMQLQSWGGAWGPNYKNEMLFNKVVRNLAMLRCFRSMVLSKRFRASESSEYNLLRLAKRCFCKKKKFFIVLAGQTRVWAWWNEYVNIVPTLYPPNSIRLSLHSCTTTSMLEFFPPWIHCEVANPQIVHTGSNILGNHRLCPWLLGNRVRGLSI